MDMDYKKVYEEWLTNPFFDEATRPIALVKCRVESTLLIRILRDFISAPIHITSAFP